MDPTTNETTNEVAEAVVEAVLTDTALMDVLDPMVILTLCGIAIACVALTTAGKQALLILQQGGVKVLDNAWFQAALEFIQPVMGGAAACIPGLLPFEPALNFVLGICAGFLSPAFYRHVLKRFFPDAVVSSESTRRAAIRADAVDIG